MYQIVCSFLFGVYIGQEYGKNIPNVKDKTSEILDEIKKSELYKKLTK